MTTTVKTQFYGLMKPDYLVKTTDLPLVTDKLNQIKLWSTPHHEARIELTTFVVICIDCICRCTCKSNYRMLAETMTQYM